MEVAPVTNFEPEPNRQRLPGLYVGNLTWWTTDQDVINAINSVGVSDVQEVRFFENRNNGQSKGFCVVTFGSETSLPAVMTKLPKLELYGQNPVVTQYNRHNLSLFESQTKTRQQASSNNGPNSHAAGIMGISSISGVHAGTQGLAYSDGMNSFNQQGVIGSGVMPSTPGGGSGGIRGPSPYHPRMGMGGMRGPRPMMRGGMSNNMGNGPFMHDMMRHPVFRQEPVVRQEPVFRQEPVARQEPVYRQDPAARQDHRSRLTWDSSSSRREGDSSRWPDERPMARDADGPSRWPDERSSGREEKSLSSSSRRLDERSSSRDEKSSSSRRVDERLSSRDDKSSSSRRQDERREEKSSSSRRSDGRSSSRRDEKSSSSSRRERSHRSRERSRSRSREDRGRR